MNDTGQLSPVAFAAASADDAEQLAQLRVEAMRPSLEAAGRFDEDRARARFLDGFEPSATRLILRDDELIGFFVMRYRPDHVLIEHLYVVEAEQGHGVGAGIVGYVMSRARGRKLPVRVSALTGSRANNFYLKQGFEVVGREEFDTLYESAAGA
ncbi:MAG: GNAT family N-acetyltransferase [Paracoccaceae bacterium]